MLDLPVITACGFHVPHDFAAAPPVSRLDPGLVMGQMQVDCDEIPRCREDALDSPGRQRADNVAAELLVGGASSRLADENNVGILSLYLTALLRQIFEAGAFRAIEILRGARDLSHAL